ncbi:metal ABC transporter solute-binding protein, Zn/Mn family [Falsibacillus albus]|uniref:Adhesin n=1 Tax=Falsibacillus albus TaxID=2478915 RepID=A0A3L7K420_9BACI|nr:zinc ABC transporter substrate-binding protein [Falsibacillus albus]RLQ97846.1 adhesin [Falsibacillus albus]
MRVLKLILSILIIISLSACSEQQKNTASKKKKNHLDIYTTVYPIQEFTKLIGGKYVTVNTIYPPGSDEHTFEPSQKDMMNLADSDLLFYVGLGLEGFVNKSEQTLKDENVKLVPLGEKINLDAQPAENKNGDVNPHIWLDPIYAKEMAKQITKTLSSEMPKHKTEFEQNYDKLAAKLDQLDSDFAKMASQAKHKEFIVSHAAYSYWESRYGLKQTSVAGISTSDEPSQQDLKKIVETAKKAHLKYILFEQNVPSRLTDVVKKAVGAQSLTLYNLAVLNENNIKNHDDYFSLMRKNIATLKKALNY